MLHVSPDEHLEHGPVHRAKEDIVVDADALVREVQAPGSAVLARIADVFGADVLDASGALDRPALGARVFGDRSALARLNAIVHPAVRAESAARFAAAFAEDPAAVVVYDVPLLVEARPDDPWDLVVVAHAPADALVMDTAPMTLDEIVAQFEVAHAAGHDVARVHSGDPSIYGAIGE